MPSGGHNVKPLALHIAGGNAGHFTKAELKAKAEGEIKFGTGSLNPPSEVKKDKIAYDKWKELVKLYKGVGFISSGDTGTIAEYCTAYSEYRELLAQKKHLSNIDIEEVNEETKFIKDALGMGGKDARSIARVFKKIDYLVSLNGYLQLDKAINSKRDQLLKFSDRLFLNPLSKIRSVPKTAQNKLPPAKKKFESQFGNV